MASGKKNYFRHSFFASNNVKLRGMMDELGKEAYFYYFVLLENCGQLCESETLTEFTFHESQLRSMWCVNTRKLKRIVEVLDKFDLSLTKVSPNLCETTAKLYKFSIPNFPKYLGRYTNKIDKEKERKEKKRKENIKSCKTPSKKAVKKTSTKKETPQQKEMVYKIISLLNNTLTTNFKITSAKTRTLILARLKDGFTFEDFKSVIESKYHEWKGDQKMSKYLRPSTLFSETHFEEYLEAGKGFITYEQADAKLLAFFQAGE